MAAEIEHPVVPGSLEKGPPRGGTPRQNTRVREDPGDAGLGPAGLQGGERGIDSKIEIGSGDNQGPLLGPPRQLLVPAQARHIDPGARRHGERVILNQIASGLSFAEKGEGERVQHAVRNQDQPVAGRDVACHRTDQCIVKLLRERLDLRGLAVSQCPAEPLGPIAERFRADLKTFGPHIPVPAKHPDDSLLG
jgi:hypothetical protein